MNIYTKKKFTKNCKLYLAAGAAQTERWNEDVKRNIKERFLCFTPKLNKSQMQHKPKKTKRVVSHPYNSWIAVSSALDWPSKFVLCYIVALTQERPSVHPSICLSFFPWYAYSHFVFLCWFFLSLIWLWWSRLWWMHFRNNFLRIPLVFSLFSSFFHSFPICFISFCLFMLFWVWVCVCLYMHVFIWLLTLCFSFYSFLLFNFIRFTVFWSLIWYDDFKSIFKPSITDFRWTVKGNGICFKNYKIYIMRTELELY